MNKFGISFFTDIVKKRRKSLKHSSVAEQENTDIDLNLRPLFKPEDFKLPSTNGRIPVFRSGGSTVSDD